MEENHEENCTGGGVTGNSRKPVLAEGDKTTRHAPGEAKSSTVSKDEMSLPS